MPRKNLTTDIDHLFRANTPKLLRDHLKKRGSASTSAYEFAMTTAELHHQVGRDPAWLRIFVVGCSLRCDPPVGGHSCNGGMIPRFHRAVSD